MQVNIDAILTTTNIPDYMTVQELQQTTLQDEKLQQLKEHIIQDWPENKGQKPQDMRTYWIFCDEMAVIDGLKLKGRHTVTP